MALKSEAIGSRLEDLTLDDRRMMFDSQLRAFRMDSQPPVSPVAGNRVANGVRPPEAEPAVDRVITLLEELSRRIEGIEKKHRHLSDEIRQRTRKDRQRRSICAIGGVAIAGFFAANWMMHWF